MLDDAPRELKVRWTSVDFIVRRCGVFVARAQVPGSAGSMASDQIPSLQRSLTGCTVAMLAVLTRRGTSFEVAMGIAVARAPVLRGAAPAGPKAV